MVLSCGITGGIIYGMWEMRENNNAIVLCRDVMPTGFHPERLMDIATKRILDFWG